MKKISIIIMLLFYFSNIQAQRLILFSSGYSQPLGIENCGDGRLFIIQREGQIFIADAAGNRSSTPYLDIRDRVFDVNGEQGLLGLAFDPNYLTNGYFYVNYINNSQNTQISRFRVKILDPAQADPASEKKILQIVQPFTNHNGGCTRFGPDGYLYIGMGDGGSGGDPNNNAQNPNSLLGKMLRIDVHSGADPYHIPADNPFVNTTGYQKEIWALGLRNPWRWSFDAKRGDMWIGDVGQSDWEEVDVQPAQSNGGENYGWRCYEGKHPYNTAGCGPMSDYVPPVTEYNHKLLTADCSIIGGFVYRGTLNPNMVGKYFYVDYCSGYFRTLYLDNNNKPQTKVVYKGDLFSYVSFGEDKNNELYVANYVNGNIYRLDDGSSSPVKGNDENINASVISIIPNPSNGNFNLEYVSKIQGKININIYNSMGTLVYNESKNTSVGSNKWSIQLRSVTKGYYNLQVSDNTGSTVSERLMVE